MGQVLNGKIMQGKGLEKWEDQGGLQFKNKGFTEEIAFE